MRGLTRLLLVAIFFLTAFRGTGQVDEVADSTVVAEDIVMPDTAVSVTPDEEKENTQTYHRKHMNQDRLQSLRSKKDFKYPDLENDTLVRKPNNTDTSQGNGFEGFDPTIFLWLILALAVVVIALQVSGVNMRQLFGSKARLHTNESDGLATENIHEIPFDKAIAEAIANRNYSAATRLLYLQSLKILADKKMINWQENKTNAQYVYEIIKPELRQAYRGITMVFEYVQYGKMEVTEAHFSIIQNMFKEFRTLAV